MSNATGIILYYGAGTVTNPRVCFRNTGTLVETCPAPNTAITTAAGNTQYDIPTGNYYVSITNTVTNGTFQVDAVQVLEAGLHEGIFDAADINADSTVVYSGGAALNGTNIDIPNGGSLEFDMTGVAFSLLVNNAATNNLSYTICLFTTAACDVSTESFVNQSTPAGISAISYAGLFDNN